MSSTPVPGCGVRPRSFPELDFMCCLTIVGSPALKFMGRGREGLRVEMNSLNFAARAGRWSAAHWKTAVAVWVAFVAVAIGVGTATGTHKLSLSEQASGEAARAEQLLA